MVSPTTTVGYKIWSDPQLAS